MVCKHCGTFAKIGECEGRGPGLYQRCVLEAHADGSGGVIKGKVRMCDGV